jgi:diaminopimelate epimerase
MNHFIVLDLRETCPVATQALSELASGLCSSPFSDDMLVLQPSEEADVRLRIFGGDGLEADFCANGLLYASSKIGEELGEDSVKVETPAGVRRAFRDGVQWQAEVGEAQRLDLDLPADLPVLGLVRAGEPHLVLGVPDALPGFNIDRGRFERYCNPLRDLTDIPGGVNVTIVFQQQEDSVLIRTFERGVRRHTFSCGTGAVSAIAAVYGTPDRKRRFHVCSPGGMHSIHYDGSSWHLAARPVRIGSGFLRDGQVCLPIDNLQNYHG